MSGIVAIFNTDGSPVDGTLLRQMTAYMATRGPDRQAVWRGGPCGLGHTLLRTTLESDRESQPFQIEENVWITADARVDARRELIGKLQSHRQDADLASPDVELIGQAYRVWGERCLDHIIGDFAFAVWDGSRQRLWCARDQFGMVPLYYARLGSTWIVSNTLNCIHLHPGCSDALNDQAIADHFLVPAGNRDWHSTTFSDIQRLPPAHTLSCRTEAPAMQRYWEFQPKHEENSGRSQKDWVADFSVLLDTVVGDRLRTRNVAAHLSGGMDSSSLTCASHALLSSAGRDFELFAFTTQFGRLVPDQEGDLAQLVGGSLGITVDALRSEDYVFATPHSSWPAPPEPSFIPETNVFADIARIASRRSRILMAGFGGDPILAPAAGIRAPKTRGIGEILAAISHSLFWQRASLVRRLKVRISRLVLPANREGYDLASLMEPSFAAASNMEERFQTLRTPDAAMRGQETMTASPYWSNIFAWGDPGFLSVPIKSCLPFFDIRLLDFLSQVPVSLLLHKRILRLAMQGRLPEQLLQRPKTPLDSGLQQTLVKESPEWLAPILRSEVLAPYIRKDALLGVLTSPDSASPGQLYALAAAGTLGYWLKYWPLTGRPRPVSSPTGVVEIASPPAGES